MKYAKTVKSLLTQISVIVAAIGGYYLVDKLAGPLDMESRVVVGLVLGLVIGSIGCAAFGALVLFGAKGQTDDDPLVSLNLDIWLHGLTVLPIRWMVFKLGSSVLIICGLLSYSDPKWYPASGFVGVMYLCVCLMLLHVARGVTKQWQAIMSPALRAEEVIKSFPSKYQS